MPTPSDPHGSDEQKRDDYLKALSQAAVRAHDEGNDAAAAGLTEAVLLLMRGKKEN